MAGSFLNLVIIRLPRMLYNTWQQEAERGGKLSAYNLFIPRSHCVHCKHTIAWFDNIPLLGFLWLRGHCRYCHHNISLRYPFIELLTALLSIGVAIRFGLSPLTLAALSLTWALIALTFIDIDHTLLPDNITLPFLWLGLFVNLFTVFQNAESAILGAILGYLFLWTVYWIFKWITHKEGMGYGDFKLLAMLAAWLGWQALPSIILISSFVGSVVGICLILFQGRDKLKPIPFGPFLAMSGFITLLWGSELNHLYFTFFNI